MMMRDGGLAEFFWHMIDWLDYWMWQARIWAVDTLYGPFPDGDTPD
jgi:hypothetical protein